MSDHYVVLLKLDVMSIAARNVWWGACAWRQYTIEPAARGQLRANYTGKLCIYNAQSFVDILMFSVETQGTIGYGWR